MFRIIQRFSSSGTSLVESLVQKNRVNVVTRFYSADNTIDNSENKTDNKKKKHVPKITLISDGDKIEITTLEEAQKLSHRRNLKLVKVVDLDVKTQRPLYRIISANEYLAEELKQREEKKSKKDSKHHQKLLQVSCKIASGDLFSKLKLVSKWIKKNYEVRVVISRDGGDSSKMEQIVKEIEKTVPEGRILQKRVNISDTRFSIVPPKPVTAEAKANNTVEGKDKQIRSYHTDSS